MMQDVINLNTSEIILVGDTHSIDRFYSIIKNTIPENSAVLHIGDCGIGFSKSDVDRLNHVNSICIKKNISAFIIRGNHDDPAYWSSDLIFSNIKLVKDYTKMVFSNDHTALCVGGGMSVDRFDRIEGVSYWSDEITKFQPEYCAKYDYIFMHDAPSYFNHDTSSLKQSFSRYCIADSKLLEDAAAQRETIDRIVALCNPEKIIGGHYHNSKFETVNGITYRCLTIDEVYQFIA